MSSVKGKMALAPLAVAVALASETGFAAINLGGGTTLTAGMRGQVIYDDNQFGLAEDPVESIRTVGAPYAQLSRESSALGYGLFYEARAGEYATPDTEGYLDHVASGDLQWQPASIFRTSIRFDYSDLHEDLGIDALFSDDLEPGAVPLLEPGRNQRESVRGRLELGGNDHRLGAALALGVVDEDFSQDLRDRKGKRAGLELGLAISTSARLVVGAARTEQEYDLVPEAIPLQSNHQDEHVVGLVFRSSRTSLDVRVGEVEKDFDDVRRSDYSGDLWRAGLTWRPRSYSTFSYTTAQVPQETQDFARADFLEVRSHTLSWGHQWSDRLSSSLAYGTSSQAPRGGTGSDTVDSRRYGLRLDLDVNRHLVVGIAASSVRRQPGNGLEGIDRNQLALTCTVEI
ncbi:MULTISPECIES: outer membrane beta-barrel protein [Microbulbifer]|uniref:outer membrane beta-barrel protein n=1 Tax=Microbulbifer TaxID=48073 RepID=UPI001E3B6316|nr:MULTISPECIES: outer membrane beta-barrel protein [Microbulbifer]UHQ54117.1 outer membrane beta-barrel protein [Microbulbifer sp. YPW16]